MFDEAREHLDDFLENDHDQFNIKQLYKNGFSEK